MEPLVAALHDTDEEVCISAAEALWKIGTPEARAALKAWRAEQDSQRRDTSPDG